MQGLTQKEFDWFRRIESEVDKVWDDLTPWERKFTEDIIEKFRLYGMKMMLSPKQWELIDRISEKII